MNLKNLVREEMEKSSELVLSYPWQDARAYAMWLAQTYYMVCHSTRLVALAGALCPLDRNEFHARFVDHAKEERGHEKVCLSDIKALGFELQDFPQLYQSAAMYQVQYYWIQQRHPVSFFGYTLALECLAEYFGARVFKILHEAHGSSATKFLKLHSEADLEHTEVAYQHIDKLTAEELMHVKENLHLSCELYRGMLSEAKAWAQQSQIRRAG